MNEYFKDSLVFIKQSSDKISPLISNEDTLISAFCFALGLERIFKGILFDINPTYILIGDSFKESAAVLYGDKILPGFKKEQEINFKPSGDLITFRKALSRVKLFSKTANKYNALLHKVSYFRDIIAHCELSKLDVEKLKEILNKDFISIIKSFSDELNIPELVDIIEKAKYPALLEISYNLLKIEELEQKIKSKLKHHLQIWESRKTNSVELQNAKDKTESIVDKHTKHYSYESFECPACKNNAIITLEYEPEIDENDDVVGHLFLTELRCYYCDLDISDYEELDFLELEQSFYEEYYDLMTDYYEN